MRWEEIAQQIADSYRRQREEAIERLRNAVVEAINEQQPPAEIVVFVLRSVEAELLTQVNRRELPAKSWRDARERQKPEPLAFEDD